MPYYRIIDDYIYASETDPALLGFPVCANFQDSYCTTTTLPKLCTQSSAQSSGCFGYYDESTDTMLNPARHDLPLTNKDSTIDFNVMLDTAFNQNSPDASIAYTLSVTLILVAAVTCVTYVTLRFFRLVLSLIRK